jgi:benzoyl-CoA 2,3-dioxygenase component B
MFTTFTDRDGKMQLEALAQSGFDPLSRTCRFMLTEEAHHMFVGESGIRRIIARTCAAMQAAGIADPTDTAAVRRLGVIDLPLIQRKINLHCAVTLDLFGNEISTNAANAFNAGLKGRFREDRLTDDHRLVSDTYPVLRLVDGAMRREDVPALSALNMRLRDDFIEDVQGSIARWNMVIEKAGYAYRLALPHVGFNRKIGEFAKACLDPAGRVMAAADWAAQRDSFLPTPQDGEYLATLMRPVRVPGGFAPWIAPPRLGIDNKPGDFEYVKIHE